MKSDEEIRRDIEAGLRQEPEIDSTDIAVKVADGIVTVSGYVRNYHEKSLVEAVVGKVAGIRAVADDLLVHAPACDGLTDPEIARAVIDALQATLPGMWQSIQAVVHDRRVSLLGVVESNEQRERVADAVLAVRGVTGITNEIHIMRNLDSGGIKRQIEEAFRSNADLDASGVTVTAQGTEITLSGEVRSVAEREQALSAVRSAPGVRGVKNQLVVKP